jgi:hypothetical protein
VCVCMYKHGKSRARGGGQRPDRHACLCVRACYVCVQHKILFIETSAKAGLNIKALFRQLAQQLPGVDAGSVAVPSAEGNASVNISLDAAAPPASSGACSC